MKGADDWAMETAVLPEHNEDFAELCAEIAKRYADVTVFQVWNEFKGYWSSRKNRWDYEGYTELYNAVYKAVKSARPDAKIGGFYLVIEGDGSENIGIKGTHNYTPLDKFQRDAIKYWHDNAVGADYILIDRGVVDHHNSNFNPTQEQAMALTRYYAKVTKEVAELVDLPIVYSEYYGWNKYEPVNSKYLAAHYASIYYNMITGAEGRDITALLWMEKENNIPHALFTDTEANGGQSTPHYDAVKMLADNFPAGTKLYRAQIDSADFPQEEIGDKIEILVSDEYAYVINKTNEDLYIIINDAAHIVKAYDVCLFQHNG
jgi:hypothetical protein